MSRARLDHHDRAATGVTTVKVTGATRELLAELQRKMPPRRSRFGYRSWRPSFDDVIYRLAFAELERLDAEREK